MSTAGRRTPHHARGHTPVVANWVCAECEFDSATVELERAAATFDALAARYGATLAEHPNEERLRRRPAPDRWSPLEYLAHAADCFELFTDGLLRARRGETPHVEIVGQDERMVAEAHNHRPVEEVLARFHDCATRASRVAATMTAEDFARPITFRWGPSDVEVLTWGTVHEISHHLQDMETLVRPTPG